MISFKDIHMRASFPWSVSCILYVPWLFSQSMGEKMVTCTAAGQRSKTRLWMNKLSPNFSFHWSLPVVTRTKWQLLVYVPNRTVYCHQSWNFIVWSHIKDGCGVSVTEITYRRLLLCSNLILI